MSQELDERDRMVLERAISGVEADLDEIRDSLAESLEAFEKNLNRAIQDIPAWLAVEPSTVFRWYQFDVDGTALLIGPRTVAFLASRVELTFQQGFEGGRVIPESELRKHLDETFSKIKQIEQLARSCALEVDAQLSDTLEEIIFDLEEKRERDERALRELVTSGDVDRGSETQKEIAELWEEQRTRTEEIRLVWERLERLVFEGIEATGDGLTQLREVLGQMEVLGLGIRGDEPPARGDDDATDDESEEHWGATDLDLPGPTAPLDVPGGFRRVERERETEELDRQEFDSKAQVKSEPDAHPPESVSKLGSEGDSGKEAQALEVAEIPSKPDPPLEPVQKSPQAVIDEPALPQKKRNRTEELGLATRTVREWEGVEPIETILVLGPFLLFVVVVAGARLLEAPPEWAYSPMVFPFGFCGVVGWLVLGTVVRHWRISWPGFRLVHWVEYEEESDWELLGDRVRVDGQWIGAAPQIYRWKSKENGGFGWMIKDGQTAILAPERNFTRWSSSELDVRDIPNGAWNVPESVVAAIRGVS